MFMGRGATVGSPALMQAQGAQAKPHDGSCPVPLSTLPKALASQGHPAPGLAGRMAAGRAAQGCRGPGTSVLSPVTWCRVHGWLLDRESAHGHGGAGFVSQAILYFNFRCIS